MSSMVQVNRVCLKNLFINRPQFLVDSNDKKYKIYYAIRFVAGLKTTVTTVTTVTTYIVAGWEGSTS